MVAPTGTHSVQDVVTYVFRQFGDESGVQIDAEDVIRWINQGQMELVSKQPIIQSIAGAFYNSKVQGYRVPSDCIQIQAVVWSIDDSIMSIYRDALGITGDIGDFTTLPIKDDILHPDTIAMPSFPGNALKPLDMSEGLKQRELLGTTGEPQYFYIWGNVIYLVPASANQTMLLRIYYNSAPSQVSTLGDLLGIPDRYYDKLLMFVMSKAYELDQDWQAHGTQRDQFEREMQSMNFADLDTQGAYPTIRSTSDGYYY